MRVFINGRFLTQRVTGVQRYAHETLRALDEVLGEAPLGESCEHTDDRPECVLLVPPGAKLPPLRHIAVRTVGKGGGQAWEQLFLPWHARTGLLLSFGATGPLVSKRQVVTVHDASVYAVPGAFSWRFRAWYKLLLPVMVHRNRTTMTVSQFSRRELMRYLRAGADKLRVSGEGWQHVTRAEGDPRIIERHGLQKRGYILAVSSMSEHKNFAVVARAAAHLEAHNAQVVVAGATDPRIFGETREDTTGRLKHVGYVSDGELRALYEHAAAFVFPSRYEGFGLPPLEAMALGCPVICADAASMPEVCQDAALYFPPDDDARLAELMGRMFSNPEARAALVDKCQAVLDRHSWQAAAHSHLSLLRELA